RSWRSSRKSPGLSEGTRRRVRRARARVGHGPHLRGGGRDAGAPRHRIARALVGIRIESLTSGRLLYERNGQKLVVPASNMKLLTMAVAAEKLGWDYTFETRLEAAGRIQNGVLTGDLIVVGTGDPSIVAQDLGPAALFGEWASALRAAGIRRVDGRIL